MGNQFKGTLDLNRLRTFIRMAAVQPLIIVRFFHRSLESGHVLYVIFMSFYSSCQIFNHGLIGGKVPGSTYKGI